MHLPTPYLGLSFGHLLQANAVKTQKDIQNLFGISTIRRKEGFAKKVEHGFQRNLRVYSLKVHGLDAQCFLDTGAVPSLITTNLARKLDLVILSAKKTITVAAGSMKNCHGAAEKNPVTFGKLTEKMDFLIVGEVLVGKLTGILEMEKLNALINLGGQYVDFINKRKAVRVEVVPALTINLVQGDESYD